MVVMTLNSWLTQAVTLVALGGASAVAAEMKTH